MSELTRTEYISELVERFQQELEEVSIRKLRAIYNYFEDGSILTEIEQHVEEEEDEEEVEESDGSLFSEDGEDY